MGSKVAFLMTFLYFIGLSVNIEKLVDGLSNNLSVFVIKLNNKSILFFIAWNETHKSADKVPQYSTDSFESILSLAGGTKKS